MAAAFGAELERRRVRQHGTCWSGVVPLPLPLASIGMPGCSLWASVDVTLSLAIVHGTALLPLSVPNLSPLLGRATHVQGLVLDPGANLLGLTATNAGQARVGGR